jgi:large subunit ribosomal protein L35
MNKPIYRFLADRKWREYRRPVLVQRITQMHVIPDVLAHMDPTADVRLYFGRRNIPPGDFVQSTTSEKAPRLNVQMFEKGEKLVTVAVIDSDVPNLIKDGFDYRCHFLAANIPLSPTSTFIDLANLAKDTQIILPWKAPYAQKGSPYHRLSTFIFEQPHGEMPNVSELQEKTKPEKFILRSFASRHCIRPIGAHLFRTQWDESMAKVMKRARVEGADIQLKRAKIEPLPYKRRNPSSMR